MDNIQRTIVILLVLAIVFSAFSILLTLTLSSYEPVKVNSGGGVEVSNGGQVALIVEGGDDGGGG